MVLWWGFNDPHVLPISLAQPPVWRMQDVIVLCRKPIEWTSGCREALTGWPAFCLALHNDPVWTRKVGGKGILALPSCHSEVLLLHQAMRPGLINNQAEKQAGARKGPVRLTGCQWTSWKISYCCASCTVRGEREERVCERWFQVWRWAQQGHTHTDVRQSMKSVPAEFVLLRSSFSFPTGGEAMC